MEYCAKNGQNSAKYIQRLKAAALAIAATLDIF
jgi:hypothetical protein